MYVYLYISPQHTCICISVFVFAPHMLDCSDMYHTVFTVILVYRYDKQSSNVLLSIQFHTNVSPLNSISHTFVTCFLGLTHHLHPLANCLRAL